ncbi:type II secretion system F family protein [Cycloclasticus sp.]|jgi:type IV pilus assembly protein PilC|uniref:type II secretion system F family protein n=1 Tax=Cycloclasticus sp. TaxID=2024830 RepID=UPI000795431E|nr:type II secretion system F family protein [Cycloclasticus sp.]KXJ61410.1 MAG: secretion system protein [Alteromonas sp. Nap_26]PHR50893.1 MAG: secretion system protein [Cycloclasticus sp.]|tara:strand:+ start:1387 stop:2589 length:1203 start_codon:yes stop_codon:yes gene_type:complete
MASYAYKAVRNDGKIIKGTLEALNVHDLESKLERTGCEVITAKEKVRSSFFVQKKITRRDLIDYLVHMEQMLGAGVPLIESLEDFREGLEASQLKDVMSSLIDKIESGQTLSESMAAEGNVFTSLMIELVKVGEVSGQLASMFGEMKDALKWQDELIAQTKKLLMYPLFVGVVVFGVLCFMMIYLVPQMTGFIIEMGGELPFHTKLLMSVSDFFVEFWYLVLLTPIMIFLGVKYLLNHNEKIKLVFDKYILHLLGIGPVLKKIILARFATNFALLYRSGIGVLDGLKITQGVVNNQYVEKEINYIYGLVTEGSAISDAFARTNLFPQLVLRMIRVGEQTGGLDKALVNVSYFYNRDVKDSIDKVQSMIEPVMTVTLGLILGWVMLSVLGPIYDLIGGLQL